MISLVMTTYNGKEYVREQMESFLRQTLPPDEVIICDDRSTDGTYEVVADFIRTHGLGWRLVQNAHNLGWRANFFEGIRSSTGDLVFLSDQDDIWHEDKIAAMVSAMEGRPEIQLLLSGFHPFYRDHSTILDYPGAKRDDGSIEKIPLDKHGLAPTYPGCSFCFRKELREKMVAYGSPKITHDAQLWLLAVLDGGLYVLHRRLMEYRRHEDAATNANKNLDRESQLYGCNYRIWTLERFFERVRPEDSAEADLRFLRRMKKWLEARAALYETKKLWKVAGILPYLSCYEKPRHFIRDCILAFR